MSWFTRIKLYYDSGSWNIEKLRNVVGKVITEKEFYEITGSEYEK